MFSVIKTNVKDNKEENCTDETKKEGEDKKDEKKHKKYDPFEGMTTLKSPRQQD